MARYINADVFEVFGYDVPKEYDVKSFGAGVCCVLEKLDKQPTADVRENVHGEWVPLKEKGDCIYKCSNCGFVRDAYILDEDRFCPHCGADMRQLNDDEWSIDPRENEENYIFKWEDVKEAQ